MKIKIRHIIDEIIADEDLRIRLQMTVMTAVLFFISFVMFLLNVSEKITRLTVITGSFSAVCLISFLLLTVFHLRSCVSYIISVSTTLMFVSFLITGGIDGFSPIWICLLPSTSMFFLGMKRATVLCVIMQVILILAFWTPLSAYLMYPYAPTFLIRFPIVYFGAIVMAFALETVRILTYNKMSVMMSLLDRLGNIDELTNIENRRYFDSKLQEFWEIVQRANGQISMLMIDVDWFKNYNDHYGHIAGDKVLVATAESIVSAINRRTDVAARWGGEEFTVLLPLTDAEGAQHVAEQIIASLRARRIPHEHTGTAEPYVTVSIGVANMFPSAKNAPDDLLQLADEALYRAKAAGRNCIKQAKERSEY